MATESFDGRTGSGLGPDLSWSTKTAGWSTDAGVASLSVEDTEAVERCEEDTGSDDHAVQVVYDGSASASYCDVGLNLRMGSSGASPARYCVKRGRTGGLLSGFYEIRRYGGSGGSDITYLRTATSLAFTAGETFRAEIEGDEIRVYQNGNLVDTVTDSTITSGHFGGLDGYRSTLGSNTRVTLASFTVEAIGGGDEPVDLTVADLTVDHTIDTLALTQVHELTVADLAVDHTVEAVSLTQVHVLQVADLSIDHTVDAVEVTQAHELTVEDLTVDHAVEGVSLTQVHELAVADVTIEHEVESVTLSAEGDLIVSDLTVEHTVETVALTQVHVLTVADVTIEHSIETVELTQTSTLVVADLTIAHEVESVTLTGEGALAVADLAIEHAVEAVALTQVHVLVVADLVIEHAIDTVTLTLGEIVTPASRTYTVAAYPRTHTVDAENRTRTILAESRTLEVT